MKKDLKKVNQDPNTPAPEHESRTWLKTGLNGARVILQFGNPVSWFSLKPKEAENLAKQLNAGAKKARIAARRQKGGSRNTRTESVE